MRIFKIFVSFDVSVTTSSFSRLFNLICFLNAPTLTFGSFLSNSGVVALLAVTFTGIVANTVGVVVLSTFKFVVPASAVSTASRLMVPSV